MWLGRISTSTTCQCPNVTTTLYSIVQNIVHELYNFIFMKQVSNGKFVNVLGKRTIKFISKLQQK